MGDKTGIQWTDATWNPIVGCSIVSPGCTNCYAMKMAARVERMAPTCGGVARSIYTGTTREVNGNAVWTGIMRMGNDATLSLPLRWKRPRRIFVNSMGDLFHESVPDEWIDRVFAVMALAPWHTFQVLTKRSKRMREYVTALGAADWQARLGNTLRRSLATAPGGRPSWPLPNVHLGVSAEDQTRADERIPDLLATPAAVRFVSAEPMLGPISFRWAKWQGLGDRITDHLDGLRRLDWIIVGGESGKGARPFDIGWAREILHQCRVAGVAAFMKQVGSNPVYGGEPLAFHNHKGGDPNEWPADLRVQESP